MMPFGSERESERNKIQKAVNTGNYLTKFAVQKE
jgi:hypothetical protein